MRPTVHDIAIKAGVSLATVDRVMNGRPGVHEKTRAKVEEAIRSLEAKVLELQQVSARVGESGY